jgi:ketosteroid isomerase-like protein
MTEQEKNIRTVKEMFEAFGRRDLKAVISSLADTVEWRCPVTNDLSGPVTWGKVRHGRREVEGFFRELLRDITPIEMKPLRFTAQGDRVVVEGADHSKAAATGREYLVNWIALFTLKNGKVTVMHDYFDTAEIARALEGRVSRAA